MSSMTDRVFLLVSLHQGSLLGVHGHTSGQTGDIWVLLRNEAALYQLISGLAEFTSRGMWSIVAAREAYAARFDSISDAIEFENFVLGIGREFLPACALAVIDERADVDAPSAETVEYYEWLLEQAKEALKS